MFKINDTVTYGMQGVCKITEIAQKNFGNETIEYYVLKPVNTDNSTIFVPKANKELTSRMRRIMSEAEIDGLIDLIAADTELWISDDRTRHAKYKEIINSGNKAELIKIIQVLRIRQQEQQDAGRKLHIADERFYKDAQKMLYDEFAVVLDIDPEKVPGYIADKIK